MGWMLRTEFNAFVSHSSKELFTILMEPFILLFCACLQPDFSLLPGNEVLRGHDPVPMVADSDS